MKLRESKLKWMRRALEEEQKTVYWPRKEQKKKRADNLKYKAVIELDKSIGYHLSSRIKKPIDAKLKGQPEWLLKYMSNAVQTFELLNHELKSKQSLPSMGIIRESLRSDAFPCRMR